MKIKVGVYSFTCCEGCVVTLVEALNKNFDSWAEKIDFVDFRALKPFIEIHDTDIAFVEGAISTQSEIKKLKTIRDKTKKLVAYGSGACNGFPSNQRNDFKGKKLVSIQEDLKKFGQIEKILPLKEFVKVDDSIDGCPVSESDVIKKIGGFLGK